MYQKSAPETIQEMFASIAHHYDRANTTFSFGLHKRWNQQLIRSIGECEVLLDLCAGTGEIAFGYLKRTPRAQAILLDFCGEMLAVAESKGTAFAGRYRTVEADAQELPLEARSVDAVTIAYGIRNVRDPLACFREVRRVLKPGGRFAILELTRPSFSLLRLGHQVYLRTLLPLLGRLAAKNQAAYRYLSQSVEAFATPEELKKMLVTAGLRPTKCLSLMGGLATLILAENA